ncbi:MAG TPA: hypothetical protein VKM55_27780 [Candidatus Lokiarchaeia archaeon]|nr:hypothetical protein [Candidatus Lokiarchaeia archaeon]
MNWCGCLNTSENLEKGAVKTYHFDDETGEFEEISQESIPEEGIKEILVANPGVSYAIFQVPFIVWLYHGPETSVQTKFKSARAIAKLRDDVLLGAKIVTVDEGSEPLPFKFVTKMANPEDYNIVQGSAEFEPAYTGSEADMTSLEKMSIEKISLLLEQIPIPEGYEREVIIHENTMYAVKNARRSFMGAEIEEIELIPLSKEATIENGTYLANDLNPRFLFENNNLVLVEMLHKSEQRKNQESIFSQLNE